MILENDKMVEMGASGIAVSSIATEPGEEAHVLRLNPKKTYERLMKTAQRYIDDGTEYDFPALLLLAGLLIYRDVRPTPRWKKTTDMILTGACLLLDKLLNEITYKGNKKKTMVCSQLVYQIYLDCGEDYTIQIVTLLEQAMCGEHRICLADLAADKRGERDAAVLRNPVLSNNVKADFDEIDIEKVSRELYTAGVKAEEADSGELLRVTELEGTVEKASEFLDLLEKVLEHMKTDIPVPALFITPADIYERAKNLEKITDCVIQRVKA